MGVIETQPEDVMPAMENQTAPVPEMNAAEVPNVQVVQLYVDSLGPEGSGADTYAGMMTTNAKLIADALS